MIPLILPLDVIKGTDEGLLAEYQAKVMKR
jgi:hypothetical protein